MAATSSKKQDTIAHDYHRNPHRFLGLHEAANGKKVIRVFRHGAPHTHVEVFGFVHEMKKVDKEGLFEFEAPSNTTFADYRIYHRDGRIAHDPYAFMPTFGEMDAYLFARGLHYKLYEKMGGRVWEQQGVQGVKFSVWAPDAQRVALVGDFNHWDGRANPLRQLDGTGIWELFVPGLKEGEKYKFEIHTRDGHLRIKSDPFALFSERRPSNASIVFNVDRHQWGDQLWREQSAKRGKESYPMNVYEVHLGSWRPGLGFRELAVELGNYCKEMGFSHVELMPVAEHPLDESWGYQVTGFFAVTSRFGTPEDFQYFVDHLHQEGIGVILDWVPAHFPTDDHSLAKFDGTCLYEHADPRKGFHPHWNTYIFNYGRFEVSNFLIASALFWLDKMHIDGLRVDAVASMLYLDYGRKEGEWIPNQYGGKENIEAIEFLRHMNSIVQEKFPSVFMFAEESTAFAGVTQPLKCGGLGFDLKWNMGWMNDTLRYISKDPVYRSYHQNDLTFCLLYAYSERFILPLSHDEVVHGKASLLSKMPGDDWQKFANLRLLYSYQICQPGKKLLFMGAELGQWEEWSCKHAISWHLLKHERHGMLQRFFKEMNHFYLQHQALWEFDFDHRGFEWIDFGDRANSVLSYLRKGTDRYLFAVHNFSPNYVPDYFLRVPNVHAIKEVFNTDREEYWGSGKINPNVEIVREPNGRLVGVKLQLAPLATMIFEVQFVY